MFRNGKRSDGPDECSSQQDKWWSEGFDRLLPPQIRSVRQRRLSQVPDRVLTAEDLVPRVGCQWMVLSGLLDSVVPPPDIKDEYVPARRAIRVRVWIRELLDQGSNQLGLQARLLAGAVEALSAVDLYEEAVEAIVSMLADKPKPVQIADTRIVEAVCEPKAGSSIPDLASALSEHVNNSHAEQADHPPDQYRQMITFTFSKGLNKRTEDLPAFSNGNNRRVYHDCGSLDPLSFILKELCNKLNIPHEGKGLMFAGRRLDLSKTRCEYSISKEATVHVMDL